MAENQVLNISTSYGQQTVASVVTKEFQQLIDEQGYSVPKDYNIANALQGAVLTIGNDRNLATANLDSIKKALFDMLVQGLSVAKTQAYFIKYGNELQMQRSYFGTQTVLKRLPEIKDIRANIVHAGDNFEIGYQDGELVVIDHQTTFENQDNAIIGAYAVIIKTDGTKQYEVMTKKMIDASWSQAKSKNVQQKFPEEMAKRTVINRAAKNIVNTSGGDDRLVGAINSTTGNEYENEPVDVTDSVERVDRKEVLSKIKEKMKTRKETVQEKKADTAAVLVDKNEAPEPLSTSGAKKEHEPAVKEMQAKNRETLEQMEQQAPTEEVPLFSNMTTDFKPASEDF